MIYSNQRFSRFDGFSVEKAKDKAFTVYKYKWLHDLCVDDVKMWM